MQQGAFDGVRVVELAQWVFVPVAGALLADWGADVVRVDRPEGDPYRALATQGIGVDSGSGVNLSVALANRGKRSLAVDLRTDGGKAVLHKLLDGADVLLTSFRPEALERLGLGDDAVRARYPRLVYARGTGYGMRGPDAGMAGYDASAFFARGGLAHVLTPPDRDYPINQRGAMGDRNGGMALAFGIAAALLGRERTGQGGVVDVSLLAMAMWTLSSDLLSALQGGAPRASNDRGTANPLVAAYRTKDGRHIQLMFLESDRYWEPFCSLVARADLSSDERFVDHHARRANAAACVATLDDLFATKTFDEWKDLLRTLDAPWAPIQAVEELLEDPQVVANDYIGSVVGDGGPSYELPSVPVQFDEQAPALRRAPEHGEHTELILQELGYTWDDIAALKDAAVIP
ncbi:MAG: CoA transferase [Acidimicrobiia bacterium]|nr:CoA transferase [Acidimicrobiia bacterium]